MYLLITVKRLQGLEAPIHFHPKSSCVTPPCGAVVLLTIFCLMQLRAGCWVTTGHTSKGKCSMYVRISFLEIQPLL